MTIDSPNINFRRHTTTAVDRNTMPNQNLNKPKFSYDFNKWIEKQKSEEPSILADVENLLRPANQRND